MDVKTIKKVAVIGSGAMGSGIAEVHIVNGYSVTMVDVNEEFLNNATGKIKKNLEFLVSKNKMSQEAANEALAKLTTMVNLGAAIKDADCIIEAVSDPMDIKKNIF